MSGVETSVVSISAVETSVVGISGVGISVVGIYVVDIYVVGISETLSIPHTLAITIVGVALEICFTPLPAINRAVLCHWSAVLINNLIQLLFPVELYSHHLSVLHCYVYFCFRINPPISGIILEIEIVVIRFSAAYFLCLYLSGFSEIKHTKISFLVVNNSTKTSIRKTVSYYYALLKIVKVCFLVSNPPISGIICCHPFFSSLYFVSFSLYAVIQEDQWSCKRSPET